MLVFNQKSLLFKLILYSAKNSYGLRNFPKIYHDLSVRRRRRRLCSERKRLVRCLWDRRVRKCVFASNACGHRHYCVTDTQRCQQNTSEGILRSENWWSAAACVLSQRHPTAVSVFSLEEDRLPRLVEVVVVVVERVVWLWTGPRLSLSLSLSGSSMSRVSFEPSPPRPCESLRQAHISPRWLPRDWTDWWGVGGRKMISRTHVNHFGTALCPRQGMHVNAVSVGVSAREKS